jgi:hypothetical protein
VVTYKNVFEKIKDNKIIIGENTITHFLTKDKKLKHITSWWLTNINYNKNYKFLKLNTMAYNLKYNKNIKNNSNTYKKYDNFNAIEVPRYTAIPSDYDGAMGVPITFLEKYNPEQFEIIHFRKGDDGKDLNINGKYLYCRIIIKKKKS